MLIRASCLTAALLLLPLAAQAQSPTRTPTIPETQLEPRKLATDYEFAATASSLFAFQAEASELAVAKSADANVRSFAEAMLTEAGSHARQLETTAQAMQVDIASPAPDGEQDRLIGQMEGADGATFDQLYVKSQVFAFQRLIPIVSGYAGEASALGQYAKTIQPSLDARYQAVVAMANRLGIDDPAQQPSSDSDTTSATK